MKVEINKKISEKYEALASQIGDAHTQIRKFQEHIKKLEDSIEDLNKAAGVLNSLDLEEDSPDEQKKD
jgi:chaperonin cofactor prefoldin